ncbi:dihydrofolate reductase family protein [Micromonospora avicenniae]|uniref:dihydrofolate reductase family protein n=1 Tax=Micromonospora avicenniae TaxID=1198245 RepID=UPI003418990C
MKSVRKLIVSNFMSLDGYFSGPGDDVMALPFDESFDAYNLERVRAADTLLFGRTTYQQSMAFWVPLAEDDSASPLQREIGRFQRDVPKVVVSDTLTGEEVSAHPATVVRRDEAPDAVKQLKSREGKEILVFGSHTTWNPLLAAGLVDELHLMVGCAAIGGGTPLFTGSTPRMELLETRRFPDSHNLVLRYAAG